MVKEGAGRPPAVLPAGPEAAGAETALSATARSQSEWPGKPRIYLHSEDLDGWLAVPNRPILARYLTLLRRLQGLRIEAGGASHEIQIVLNSGKAPEYLEREARRFGGRFVISGNGAAWREVGGRTHRLVPPSDDFLILRGLLGLGPEDRDVVRLALPGRPEVALEDKRDEEGEIVFSLFPEPDPVAHRWTFRGGIDPHSLKQRLEQFVSEHGLRLHVPPPHRDGAVDVLPLLDGRPVGKWTLRLLAARMFPGAQVRLTHGGDAVNDLSAMEGPGVIALTAAGCEVADAVRRLGGVVAPGEAPDGGAPVYCYRELARREWYGPLSGEVAGIAASFEVCPPNA